MLDLDLEEPVYAIVSTATLRWVTDHDPLWARLAQALRPTERRLREAGFTATRCWLEERPT